jgi:hypothetical protein
MVVKRVSSEMELTTRSAVSVPSTTRRASPLTPRGSNLLMMSRFSSKKRDGKSWLAGRASRSSRKIHFFLVFSCRSSFTSFTAFEKGPCTTKTGSEDLWSWCGSRGGAIVGGAEREGRQKERARNERGNARPRIGDRPGPLEAGDARNRCLNISRTSKRTDLPR